MKLEAVRNWNEPQGSCQAWVIATDGVANPNKGYSSKKKGMDAIKQLKIKLAVQPKPRFKDIDQQKLYEGYLNITDEELSGVLLYKSATDVAFTRGYTGEPLVGFHNYPKNTLAYTAYAAGKARKAREAK
jgi:hypothetical protein